ncbi:carboxypeptidase regulatory-like domain-containing protein [Meiothermus sp. QL-1]|uniref:PEGA domain-containing protein n=1 Tax=Meiothermus sp. QL-1 TaxID=2058095 RepID=UPI000E0BD43F|nr:PEGA domain-containing protein [Meiothermus sp. QL-1]RDI95348.1 carboxypeptidase regulatory-like domain-containing protein [Meiothermus sp. QL-1]
MSALFLWILGILGVLVLLYGLTRLQRNGLSWMGFGLLLGLFGLGGAWLHQHYGNTVFWGLGVLGVLLLLWALFNLKSRLAGWVAALAVLLGLTGFGSLVLLNSSAPNLLTSPAPPTPMEGFRPEVPEEPAPSPPPEPEAQPEPPPPAEALPAEGRLREVLPTCPCPLEVRVNAPSPTVRILQDGQEVARSTTPRSLFLLEAGAYTLEVEAPGYRPLSAPIRVPESRNLEVDLAQ